MLTKAAQAADAARAVLLHYFGRVRQVDRKVNQSLVSVADIESEQAIKKYLNDGSVGFLAEESGVDGPVDRCWIIDPLDGTTNYLHGLPFFAVSIGLEVKNEMMVGLVDLPLLQTRYWAIKGQGAFRDGVPIHVSSRPSLSEGLLATGFSTSELIDTEIQLRAVEKVIQRTRGVRRVGSAAIDLCWVAEGLWDGFWEKHLQPWDTAAGSLIVREAGGCMTNYSGDNFKCRHTSVVASNGLIHGELLKLLGLS